LKWNSTAPASGQRGQRWGRDWEKQVERHVLMNRLAPSTVDKMLQGILDKGLKSSTVVGDMWVLSVTLGHAKKSA